MPSTSDTTPTSAPTSTEPRRRCALLAALLVLGLSLPAFAGGAGGEDRVTAVPDDALLVHYDASLVTRKITSATDVQDVLPVALQRGAFLDGTSRAGSAFGWMVGASPFGESMNGQRSWSGIDLATGSYTITTVDLALPARQPWVVGRSYNSAQTDSGSSHRDSDGYQGHNWMQMSQPELVFYDDAGSSDDDLLYLVYGADRYIEFRRRQTDDTPTYSSTAWRAVNGGGGVIIYASGSPDTYTYYDQRGNEAVFFGDNTASNKADWQLWKVTDAGGSTAYVGNESTASTAVTDGYDASGRILYAYDSSDRRYSYTYTSVDGTSRLTEVKAETKTSGTWASPSGVTEVGSVEYEYYASGSTTYGASGNLKQATVVTPLTDSGIEVERKTYYRYWTGSFDDSTNPGHEYALQYIVGAEGVRRFDWSDTTFDDDHFAASESILKPYAASYFEYDSSHRIDKAWFNGECGCSGANNGEHTFTYATNGSHSATGSYDNDWLTRVVVGRPDGTYVSRYFDEAGQPLSSVITDGDPGVSYTDWWATYVTRTSAGLVDQVHTPARVSTYTHSTGSFGEASTGLEHSYTYESSGPMAGLRVGWWWRDDTGSAMVSRNIELGSITRSGAGEGPVVLPIVSDSYAQTAEETSEVESAAVQTIAIAQVIEPTIYYPTGSEKTTSTLPAIIEDENGSGSSNTRLSYLNEYKEPTLTKSPDGRVDYTERNSDGQVTLTVRDANTADTAGVFNGFNSAVLTDFASNGGGDELALQTSMTYDAQGRSVTTTLPSGRVTQRYYTRLQDHRLVTISIPRVVSGGSTTYYGPVSLTVTNHAGKAEFSGTVAFSGGGGATTTALTGWIDEADDDPFTALDTGTFSGVSVSVYDSAGSHLDESWMVFDLPASMAAATEGTHYDATTFGYDVMGRRWRVKDATGTISRTVFDDLGRAVESWMGTNDYSFTDGEASGPDDMVKVSTTEYDDGNDQGNSYVTETIQDPDGNWGTTSDQRVTSYLRDARGRVIVTVGPQAPYTVVKYDERNRVVASGQYSSSGSLSITTDPTSVSSNRVALSETLYDRMDRVYRTERYKINQSTGAIEQESSSDIMLVSETWYDEAGRTMKSVGEQITKQSYDRLGRPTHRFIIANVDDGATNPTKYTDAQDVDGDVVLEEHQTAYEDDTSNVLARVTIARLYDDKGGGETTGALDTQTAESDPLKWTNTDIEGRIQITAMWYDEQDRLTDTVALGTNGGSTYDRGGASTPPARSNTVLRSTIVYNDDGTQQSVTDPEDLEMRYVYDDARRVVATISNYVNGTPSSATGADDNFVRTVYTDGLQTEMWVDLDGDGTQDADDQVTTYTYGVDKGASAGDSLIGSGRLLQSVAYPDSGGASDVVSYAYNALGQQVWMKDQSGNIIETDYDTAGRQTHRRVTTLDGDFDGAVRRISTAYDSRGMVDTVDQYDNATVGSGSVTDGVEFEYNEWGQLTRYKQDHDSAYTGGSNGWQVILTYEEFIDHGPTGEYRAIRRKGGTYPSGGTLTFPSLGTANRHDAEVNRVTQVTFDSLLVAVYQYNGLSALVGTRLDEPNYYYYRYDHAGSAGNMDFVDRFNRVTSDIWTRAADTDSNGTDDLFLDLYDLDLTYDRNSNIELTEDGVFSAKWDVDYTIDDLNRLTDAQRGTYSGGSITSEAFQESWTLSQTGNWEVHQLDLNGDNDTADTDELNDDATFNVANELTARDIDDDSSNDYTLAYDEVGNLIDDAEHHEYVYDAFGRLRQVKNQSSTIVADYRYNGLGQRISWHYDVDADGTVESTSDDPEYHFVYDEKWRPIETYRYDYTDFDSDPHELFVYHNAGLGGRGGSSYIDRVILRDRDANTDFDAEADGTLEERTYYLQNWRADVIALVEADGSPIQQIRYDAYGVPFGIPKSDMFGDGSVDSNDYFEFASLLGASNVRADWDFDGDFDGDDNTAYTADNAADDDLGRGAPSYAYARTGGNNRKLYAGYEYDPQLAGETYHVRHRVLLAELGRWSRRDPLGYADGMSLCGYIRDPIARIDPLGLVPHPVSQDILVTPDDGYLLTPWTSPRCQAYCSANPNDLGRALCHDRVQGREACACFANILRAFPNATFAHRFRTCVVAHELQNAKAPCDGNYPDNDRKICWQIQNEVDAYRAIVTCMADAEPIDCGGECLCEKVWYQNLCRMSLRYDFARAGISAVGCPTTTDQQILDNPANFDAWHDGKATFWSSVDNICQTFADMRFPC